ncbi:MAG TPA: 4'-phosphopantetheinyl transferase superfamily protein [Bacillota bacterium]|nr:4'-phosphopantetheinyl transferase superfamily protein [Bacillota bacterium]
MYLYLYYRANHRKGQTGENENRAAFHEELLRQALGDYLERNGCTLSEEALSAVRILREEKGKPYFPDLIQPGFRQPDQSPGIRMPAVHFSVSHSGGWWGCLMADEPVGFDLEVCREKVGYEKIARHFFAEEECGLIIARGREAFFDVWVRKEAYVKYLGSGLAEGLSSFSVVENGELSPQVIGGRASGYLGFCEIGPGVRAAYCCAGGDPVKGTILLK